MDQTVNPALFYRIGLIEGVTLLTFLVVAFGAITVLARVAWLQLGLTESLLARLAVAAVLAATAVGGASGVLLNLLQPGVLSDNSLTLTTSRNQALLGIGLALTLAVVAIIRIEMYHRNLVSPPVQEEDADWKQ